MLGYNVNMNISAVLTDLDAVVVTSPANLFYLSGMTNADAIIVLTNEQSYYVTSPLYEVDAQEKLPQDMTAVIVRSEPRLNVVRRLLGDRKRIGIEGASMDVASYLTLFVDPGFTTTDVADRFAQMRRVKTTSELETIKHAEGIVDKAFAETIPAIRVGMTEREVRYLLQDAMFRYGADGVAFDTIVAFGENAAKPHAVPSDRPLRKGDCIVMDFGAKYNGYCSDFTRTIFCGTPTKRFIEAYECVLKAHLDAVEYFMGGGRNAADADKIAREVIDSSSYKGLFTHSLGHGVGIEIHESPYLKHNSLDVIGENEVFTIEPGVYAAGEFGIRIESLVAIENGKLTVIDRSNKEIITL